MNKIRTNITLDPKLKLESTKILEELGLDLSTAISLFLKQVVIQKGLPFDISKSSKNIFFKYSQLKNLVEQYFGFDKPYASIDKIMSKKDIKEANKELEDIKKGKLKLKKYNSFLEGLKDLDLL